MTLLSPSAIIIPDPDSPAPQGPGTYVLTNNYVSWDSGAHLQTFGLAQIRFQVQNDGSPIDFQLERGTDGSAYGDARGRIQVDGLSVNVTGNEGDLHRSDNLVPYYACKLNLLDDGPKAEPNTGHGGAEQSAATDESANATVQPSKRSRLSIGDLVKAMSFSA